MVSGRINISGKEIFRWSSESSGTRTREEVGLFEVNVEVIVEIRMFEEVGLIQVKVEVLVEIGC